MTEDLIIKVQPCSSVSFVCSNIGYSEITLEDQLEILPHSAEDTQIIIFCFKIFPPVVMNQAVCLEHYGF
jgi:hypothetical protein